MPKKPAKKVVSLKGHNSKGRAASKKLIAKGRKYYTHAYKPREMILDHGIGAMVWDLEGKDYVDLGAGIAVSALGHHNKDLFYALMEQANKLWHTSNIFFTEPPILLAEELAKASKFAKRVFFTNSGTEANEAAIKLVRKYAADKGRGPEKREIITFTGSFHGRTLAAVTATAQPKYHIGFEPMPAGFTYLPFNDFDAVEKAISEKTCAVMLEPLQGEGGITAVRPNYLKHVQKLCQKHDALLVLDEVQCGMGRTGKLFAFFHEEGVVPDVVTLAKALGGGMPIGAMLIGERAENTFQFGSHGSTFGGNPLACAVAREVLKKLQTKELIKNVKDRSIQLASGLAVINNKHGMFREIRGRGLMMGAELQPEWHGKAGDISDMARKHGVLVLQAGPNVLRFVPPLNITEKEMKEGLARLMRAMDEYRA